MLTAFSVSRVYKDFGKGISYNFSLSVSCDADEKDLDGIESFLRLKMWEIRRDHKWSMKRTSRSRRIVSSTLRETYNLVNFVRVPVEEDITLEVP